MSVAWLYSLASVIVVSLISLVGIFALKLSEDTLKRTIFILVSLATGGLLGDAFIHILPEAYAHTAAAMATSVYVLAGIFVFFILEKFLRWRHEHVPYGTHYGNPSHAVGMMNLIADGVHNFIDGMVIAASYLVSIPIGIATTLAVLLHELPQEIGDYGILLHAGFSKARALFFNFLSALTAIIGAIMALAVGAEGEKLSSFLLPFTAGAFIYIAGSDLVPELHKEHEMSKSLLQLLAMSIGVGLMLLLRLVG